MFSSVLQGVNSSAASEKGSEIGLSGVVKTSQENQQLPKEATGEVHFGPQPAADKPRVLHMSDIGNRSCYAKRPTTRSVYSQITSTMPPSKSAEDLRYSPGYMALPGQIRRRSV